MIVKWRVVIPVEVTVYCGECGGQMRQTGLSYTVMPPLYEHRCELCGRLETADQPYPLVQYHGTGEPKLPQHFDLPPVIDSLS